ncbi:phospholipid-transporting ATPase IF-like isoform X2 [Mytilus californianus]|uniref:phospholipid-transporting ATPase IF-like isoform X2 n=1 Tax=Mytilus californianus TaxID=6549 RepID=UPI0022474DF0|nr:phospholipid-transporting ATPase IF-like isoform X2 [Mytilus californianus]
MNDCFSKCKKKAIQGDRTVYVGSKRLPGEHVEVVVPHKYPDNRVISSKYTSWNFIPKNLFEQFRRLANFYFLCVGFIQLIIDSPVSPATSITPLVFVVVVTAIKQGYEDWLRHKADNEVNNREAYVVRDGKVAQVKSMDITVGDIVKVKLNHSFPCDLVLLSSHDTEGKCYVTTANLDGETNLKTHYSIPDTKHYQTDGDFGSLHAMIECQQPIPDLYKFVGRMTVDKNGENAMKSLGPENVLLRGARLKNTPYVYGCAVYTGSQTKMALNSKAKSTKFSRVERGLNTFLLAFIVMLLTEALISTILKYWFVRQDFMQNSWYLPTIQNEKKLTVKSALEDFLAFMVLYNYIIPISLYVTVEVQKFVGSMFIGWDLEMYDTENDQPAKANTSDLNEELGQVEYLFTDKTGTLTENDMQFRQCSIHGKKYEEVGGMLCEVSLTGGQSMPVHKLTPEIEEFFALLALCHTVRVDHPEMHQTGAAYVYSHTGMEYEYQSSSPDEKAFVEACRRYAIIFHGLKDGMLEITFKGKMKRYQQLHVLEFDPTRKRMSVIIKNEEGEVYLLCKGAESAILDRVIEGEKQITLQHVNEFATYGLRTLVLAQRKLSEKDIALFDAKLQDARTSLQNREEKLAEVFDFMENELHVLGATAIEDKLQEDVPKTIESLRMAGIKVWVLTGDKEETAVNISYSAGHFKQGMTELRLTKITDSIECAEAVRKHMISAENNFSQGKHNALIIDGTTLTHALYDHGDILRDLCHLCVAVLCCRMSPLQKAEVVKLIKNGKDAPVTAAIGDGANDVSMIQEAHVGLGIMGKEGRQAVRNSDYAFSKFKFLNRMLLLHGHFFYIRISTLVNYFFYKNVAFITSQLFYMFFSAFSQQSLFDSFYLMFYNITFTSLPIFLYSLFEQHTKQSTLLEQPQLYKKITRNRKLSKKYFIQWNALGLWHAVVFFFGVFLMFNGDITFYKNGKMMGNWMLGSVVYITCVLAVNIKLGLETYYWSAPIFFSYIFAFVGNVAMTSLYTGLLWPDLIISHQDFYHLFFVHVSCGPIWLCMIILIVIALLPDIVIRCITDIQKTKNDSRRPHSDSTIPLKELSPLETEKFVTTSDDSPQLKSFVQKTNL